MSQARAGVASEAVRHAVGTRFLKHFRCDMSGIAHIEGKQHRSRRVRLDHVEQKIARPKQFARTGSGRVPSLFSNTIRKRIEDAAWSDEWNGALVTARARLIVQHRENVAQAIALDVGTKSAVAGVDHAAETKIGYHFWTFEFFGGRRQLVCQ